MTREKNLHRHLRFSVAGIIDKGNATGTIYVEFMELLKNFPNTLADTMKKERLQDTIVR